MKRSAQVALVLMSAATVGGAGYAMMPRQSCVSPGGAVPNAASPNVLSPKAMTPNGVAPKGVAPNAVSAPCTSSRSSWSFHSGRSIFGTWNSSNSSGRTNFSSSNTSTSTATTTSRTAIGGTTRGGFGGTSTALAPRGG